MVPPRRPVPGESPGRRPGRDPAAPPRTDTSSLAHAQVRVKSGRGDPAEVAAWIVRLADPSSTWLTGQTLAVDGGLNLT
nr:SDR family oxidoreductase [Actinomadura sp. NAK00032]